jgi:hypothetical protein
VARLDEKRRASGNQGHGKSIFGILTNQADAPKGVVDNDGSYMNRSKYTESSSPKTS